MKDLGEKLDALTIFLTSPIWPARASLTPSCQALWDAMSVGENQSDLKQYCVDIIRGEYAPVLAKAEAWFRLADVIMDDPAAIGTDGRVQMLAVLKHFVDAAGFDFSALREAA